MDSRMELENAEFGLDGERHVAISIDFATSDYLDDKIVNLFGHFRKDFEGPICEERLGIKFGGYGSFARYLEENPPPPPPPAKPPQDVVKKNESVRKIVEPITKRHSAGRSGGGGDAQRIRATTKIQVPENKPAHNCSNKHLTHEFQAKLVEFYTGGNVHLSISPLHESLLRLKEKKTTTPPNPTPPESSHSKYHNRSDGKTCIMTFNKVPDVNEGDIRDHWVCCDECEKWRLLPFEIHPDDLPEKWSCAMLDWLPGMNDCSFSEEATTEAVNVIYNSSVPQNVADKFPARKISQPKNVHGSPRQHTYTSGSKRRYDEMVESSSKKTKIKCEKYGPSRTKNISSQDVSVNQRSSILPPKVKTQVNLPSKELVKKLKMNKKRNRPTEFEVKDAKRLKSSNSGQNRDQPNEDHWSQISNNDRDVSWKMDCDCHSVSRVVTSGSSKISENKSHLTLAKTPNVDNSLAKDGRKKYSILLKEARALKHVANNLKDQGLVDESTTLYFQAAMKFLHAASLLEATNYEDKLLEMYYQTAKLFEYCAHEYMKYNKMAAASLAYKCVEVAYMRVVFVKHSNATRDRQELQSVLIPKDNLGELTMTSTAAETEDAIFAMAATTNARMSFANAYPNHEDQKYELEMSLVKRALNFSFHNIEGLLRLVRLSMESIEP